jgi:hypothetical protein
LRVRGGPARDSQEGCRPWLFQAAPGSYQFSVAIQEVKQLDLFKEDPRPDLVAHQFLEILKATASDDLQQLQTVVPKADYRDVFLKLSRNLAPTGKTFGSIEIRAATGETPIALTPEARKIMNQTIKQNRPVDAASVEEEIVGTLRAVDLEKDFLDVVIASGQSLHIVGLSEAMDDVVGPMVNKPVKVQIIRESRGVRFRDIELDD